MILHLGFPLIRKVGDVFLFDFADSSRLNVNLRRYEVEVIEMKKLIINPKDSPAKMLRKLNRYVQDTVGQPDLYVVRLKGTNLGKANHEKLSQSQSTPRQFRRTLTFKDYGTTALAKHIRGKRKTDSRSHPTKFRTFASPENDVYLFPIDTNTGVCTLITNIMAYYRKTLYYDE